RGTDAQSGAFEGIACSYGLPFNDPAIFPGFDLADGKNDVTFMSTGVYGAPTFVSTLYFHLEGDAAHEVAIDVPETAVGSTAPDVRAQVGGIAVTISRYSWNPSGLDRVGFGCSFGDGGEDYVGHLTIRVGDQIVTASDVHDAILNAPPAVLAALRGPAGPQGE